MKTRRIQVCLALIPLLVYSALTQAQTVECVTPTSVASDTSDSGDPQCPFKGACDNPEIRDQWDPFALVPQHPLTFRARVHVFRGGALAGLSQEVLEGRTVAQQDTVRAHFLVWKIDVAFAPHHILPFGTGFETVDTEEDVAQMKASYAENPASQLNVYVSNFELGFGGQGRYPWSPGAMETSGGIMVDDSHFDDLRTTLTHEFGHNLGLWHDFHGVDAEDLVGLHGACAPVSQAPCSCNCFEEPDRSDCDYVGDFCCDTPATPVNTACCAPSGADDCTSDPWGTTAFHNYMRYARDISPPYCRDHFTTQQARRMLCWACTATPGWVLSPDCNQNGKPDACDIAGPISADCNCNGVPDECDIVGGLSDGNHNGVPDACESSFGACCLAKWPEQVCESMTACHCEARGGVFVGAGTKCSQVTCLLLPDSPQGDPDGLSKPGSAGARGRWQSAFVVVHRG